MISIRSLVEVVQDGKAGEAATSAKQIVQTGTDVEEIIEALTVGMREIGERFARMEIFLPELMLSARAMQAVMEILEPELQKLAVSVQKKGTMVIGTIAGDVHEIGKNVVVCLLKAQGFEVYDLGFDVNALDFVRKAEEVNADIIGVSSLMTTTMPGQQDIVKILEEKGIREKYHVIVGGAPVTQAWVTECGADSWGENAGVTVDILERVMAEKRTNDATV